MIKKSVKRVVPEGTWLFKTLERIYDFFKELRRIGNKGRLPDFLIIGAQKSGTSSLWHYLSQHPGIKPAYNKEIHYFSFHYDKPMKWYRSYFPRAKGVTGEASTSYLFHPQAAERAAKHVPDAKIIVLLRDPVERAYSQYRHQVRQGREKRSFLEALKQEDKLMKEERKKMEADENYYSEAYDHYSYQARGEYASQLKRWYKHYPKKQVLVIDYAELAEHPSIAANKALKFLGLEQLELTTYDVIQTGGKKEPMSEAARKLLEKRFSSENKKLKKLVGEQLSWL